MVYPVDCCRKQTCLSSGFPRQLRPHCLNFQERAQQLVRFRAGKRRGRSNSCCHLLPDNCPRLANSGSYWQLHELSFLGYRGKALGLGRYQNFGTEDARRWQSIFEFHYAEGIAFGFDVERAKRYAVNRIRNRELGGEFDPQMRAEPVFFFSCQGLSDV